MQQLFIPTNKGITAVYTKNIIRVEASSNYCKVHFDNANTLTVAKVLHWFEDKLPKEYFYRIHRTHIVNSQFISAISLNSKLTLINGEEIQTSRRKKSLVRQLVA